MGIVAVCIVLVLVIGGYARTRGGGLSIVPPGRAAALLDAVQAAADLPVRGRGVLERDGPDGPMPEIAERWMTIDADAAEIRARVRRACRSLGMADADAERRRIEADTVCDGGAGHGGESVHLSLRCAGTCTAYLQTQVLGS